jgi:hypothetical protein
MNSEIYQFIIDIMYLFINNTHLFLYNNVAVYVLYGKFIDKMYFDDKIFSPVNDEHYELNINFMFDLVYDVFHKIFMEKFKDSANISFNFDAKTITYDNKICVKMYIVADDESGGDMYNSVQIGNLLIFPTNHFKYIFFDETKKQFCIKQITDVPNAISIYNTFKNINIGTWIPSHNEISPALFLSKSIKKKYMDSILWDYTQHSKTLNMNLMNIYSDPNNTANYNYKIINDLGNIDPMNIVYQDINYVPKKTLDTKYYLYNGKTTLEIEKELNSIIHQISSDDCSLEHELLDLRNDNYFHCYRLTKYITVDGVNINAFNIESAIGKIIHIPFFLSAFYTLQDANIDWLLAPDSILLVILVARKYKNFIPLAPCSGKCFFGDENEILFETNVNLSVIGADKRLFETNNLFYMNTLVCELKPSTFTPSLSSNQNGGQNYMYPFDKDGASISNRESVITLGGQGVKTNKTNKKILNKYSIY